MEIRGSRREPRVAAVLSASVALLFVVSASVPAGAYPRPGRSQLVSLSSAGQQATPPTFVPGTVRHCGNHCRSDLSAGGRFVAFETEADGLVAGDTNDASDVFVRDLKEGTTVRVSVASDGTPGEGACTPDGVSAEDAPAATFGSFGASINAKGRYVVFSSCSANLSLIDAKHTEDVFVHDRAGGATELVSQSSDGLPAFCVGGISCSSAGTTQAISASGRYVVFDSNAANLVVGDTNAVSDVFVRDRHEGTTERISVTSEGSEAQANVGLAFPFGSLAGSISDDGRYVVFLSDAPNLAANAPDEKLVDNVDVFVHDRSSGETEQIDVDADGNEDIVPITDIETLELLEAAISPNGRYVAFISRWDGFVPNDTNDAYDVFVHDRKTGRKERVSVGSTGGEGDSYSMGHLAFSADGRFITFASTAHIDPDDDEGGTCGVDTGIRDFHCGLTGDKDVYVYDRITGSAELVSRNRDGGTDCDPDLYPNSGCPGWTWSSSISADGRYVSFQSDSQQLVKGDENDVRVKDHFVRDRGTPLGGGLGGNATPSGSGQPEPLICLQGICLPPGAAARTADLPSDATGALSPSSAELLGVSLAYRPGFEDLFLRLDVERLAGVRVGPDLWADATTLYGARLRVDGADYELRAAASPLASLPLRPTIGLFSCTDRACHEIARLRGGYGTTGEQVVASIPLALLGLQDGGRIEHLHAFSALGTFAGGAEMLFDRVTLH